MVGCEARRTGQIPSTSDRQASLGVGRVYNLEVFVYLSQLDLDNNQPGPALSGQNVCEDRQPSLD